MTHGLCHAWKMKNEQCKIEKVTSDKWQVTSDMWHVSSDKWQFKWQMTNTNWQLTTDNWQMTTKMIPNKHQHSYALYPNVTIQYPVTSFVAWLFFLPTQMQITLPFHLYFFYINRENCVAAANIEFLKKTRPYTWIPKLRAGGQGPE